MRQFITVVAVAALVASLPAQDILGYDSTLNVFVEAAAISPAWPAGGIPLPPFGLAPALPATGPLMGAVAMDNTTGIVWASNGPVVAAMNHPAYPPLAPVPAPGLWAWTPPPPMGPVIHGMTIVPGGGPGGISVTWVTDGVALVPMGVPPVLPLGPVIALDTAVGGMVPVVAPPLTGLDFDRFTNTFWAVDSGGFTYNFTSLAYLGPGPPPPPALPLPAMGITIDRTGGTLVTPGLYVAGPGLALEVFSGGTPIPLPSLNQGLTFHAIPAQLPGASSCPNGLVPVFAANGPAVSGSAGFSLVLGGVPPNSLAALLVDVIPIIGGWPFARGLLYIDPWFSPTYMPIVITATPATPYVLPLPLVGTPPGIMAYGQWVVMCPGGTTVAVSDGLQMIVSLP